MAEAIVQVSPDSTGKKIRTIENTVGGNLVEQQVVTLATSDGTIDETQATLHKDLQQLASTAPGFFQPEPLIWFARS